MDSANSLPLDTQDDLESVCSDYSEVVELLQDKEDDEEISLIDSDQEDYFIK